MAYRGTKAATTAPVVEKGEDRHRRSAAGLTARRGGTVGREPRTATARLPTKSNTQPSESCQLDHIAAAATAAGDELVTRVIALTIVGDSRTGHGETIATIPELKRQLEGMCRTIFMTLGRQQSEGAYQQALKVELEDRGVAVQQEPKVYITYKSKDITSRRADLLLTLADGSTAIVEMKAVSTITKGGNLNAVHQLQYYLDAFNIDNGFLVNFPHDAGFPPPPSGGIFRQEPICGVVGPLSDVRTRERKEGGVGSAPEIVYFRRVS